MSSSSYLSYHLPEERIAQRPSSGAHRELAKLLHVSRDSRGLVSLVDRKFQDLLEFLEPEDLLVINCSRVLPSRFFPRHVRTGSSVEVFLIQPFAGSSSRWLALSRPMRRLREGDELRLNDDCAFSVVGRSVSGRELILELQFGPGYGLEEIFDKHGSMPIPPYIRGGRSDIQDVADYQTVYAEVSGSVAAPTAGLHFSDGLLEKVRAKGVRVETLVLHVGPASFRAVDGSDLGAVEMPSERIVIKHSTRLALEGAVREGRRIVAVGTTSVRSIESYLLWWAHSREDHLSSVSEDESGNWFAESRLFISPGYSFQGVGAIVTNFHQPNTTHLCLVAAFIGEDETMHAYRHALSGSYSFLSYGDAMFLTV